MVQPPLDDELICSRCGQQAPPFGRLHHRFVYNGRPLCLACARDVIPERVAIAEMMDAFEVAREGDN